MLKRIKLAGLRALITVGVLYLAGYVVLVVALRLNSELPISFITLGVGIIIGAGIGSFFTALFLKMQEEDDGAGRQKLKQQADIAHKA